MLNEMKRLLSELDESLGSLQEQELMEYLLYAVAHERTMTELETYLHSVEEPVEIAQKALIAGVEFYDGDWCGIIEGDLDMEAWCPVLWYNRQTHGMTETRFRESEDTLPLNRWIQSLNDCKAVYIPDTSVLKETSPEEYAVYERLHAKSILAVPFWKNPVGFLIVRNPKRFAGRSSFLQALAYVVFSSVTEKKLIERSQKAFSPEYIKSDKDVMINLFGKLEITTSKGVLTEEELNSPKISRFLVYMLLHRERAALPRVVCDTIWENEDNDNPGSKMKNLAFRLQSGFGIISDYRLVISTPQGYQFNPELNIITDVDLFDEYRTQVENAMALQTKIELLKSAADLYKGDIFPTARSEHWLLSHELAYRYRCLGIYNDLMRAYFESKNYSSVQYYASLALKIEPANADAYYWLIRSLRLKDSTAQAKGELQMAAHVLSEEEYANLLARLDKQKD